MSEYKGVFVFVEQRDKEIQKVSLELIGKATELAGKLGEEVTAVVLGSGIKKQAEELVYYGADSVIIIEDEMLDIYTTEPYTKALAQVCEEKKPNVFMFGATAIGRDLAPRVSARVHTGLTADCTTLDVDDETKNLLMTRPAFGGNIMATIICPDHRPQMSTVRPGVMIMNDRDESKSGNVEEMKVAFTKEDLTVEVLEVVKETAEMVNIEDANILISGGRGVGSAEGFDALSALATEIGGQVSASRACVDAGWIDRNQQVGQTGKTVRPGAYFACGISGAIQHLAGMEESEFIIAINKDAGAPIFEVADLGIVGDINKVLPALVEELKAIKED